MNAAALDPIAEAAIDWLVRLNSGCVGADEQLAFARWLQADPRHEAVWREMAGVLEQPVAAIRQAEARQPGQQRAAHLVLGAPARRKALRSSAAGLLLLGLGGYVLHRQQPLEALLADMHTATGERRRAVLADGSVLLLDARSAVNIDFGAQVRLLNLRQGQILVEAAAAPGRPLIVRTEHGEARALGTRFVVRRGEAGSELAVLDHSVQLTAANGSRHNFAAGRAARYDAQGIVPLADSAAALAAWSQGLLDVRDRPMGEVIAALRSYQRGYLRISPQAAALRVFGVFPLDDPDATLASLAETQPIVIRRFAGLLTRIEHRNEIS